MLASGQSLSSSSGSGHWLSSSSSPTCETGKPESRSKQALKRLWIDTICVTLMSPACNVLGCSEEEGRQGEQGVQFDHSLATTYKKGRGKKIEGQKTEQRHIRDIYIFSFLPSHSLVSQWNVPSWQRLEKWPAEIDKREGDCIDLMNSGCETKSKKGSREHFKCRYKEARCYFVIFLYYINLDFCVKFLRLMS